MALRHDTGLPQWLSGKESTCNAEDTGSIPGSGRSPGGGHGHVYDMHLNSLRTPSCFPLLEFPSGHTVLWGLQWLRAWQPVLSPS